MFSHSWSKGSYCKLGCCCCIGFISSCTKDFLLLLTGFSKSFVKHGSVSQLATGRWCVETLCCDQLAPLEKQKKKIRLINIFAVLSQKLVSVQYVVNLTVLLLYCALLWTYSTESRSQKTTKQDEESGSRSRKCVTDSGRWWHIETLLPEVWGPL